MAFFFVSRIGFFGGCGVVCKAVICALYFGCKGPPIVLFSCVDAWMVFLGFFDGCKGPPIMWVQWSTHSLYKEDSINSVVCSLRLWISVGFGVMKYQKDPASWLLFDASCDRGKGVAVWPVVWCRFRHYLVVIKQLPRAK